ncbi:hypothetical protein [Metaplanococcus flavidus]|uniref:Uncharacterized protein n=1 Tax=Metaplanococcus flavidus TaxID=569883 RepID=A0ABW3LF09_9BACL
MKKYSWISYLSLGIPLVLIALWFVLPNLTQGSLTKTIFYAQIIGAPLAVILSMIALIKKNEKNMIAILGLALALILLIILAILVIFVRSYTP